MGEAGAEGLRKSSQVMVGVRLLASIHRVKRANRAMATNASEMQRACWPHDIDAKDGRGLFAAHLVWQELFSVVPDLLYRVSSSEGAHQPCRPNSCDTVIRTPGRYALLPMQHLFRSRRLRNFRWEGHATTHC